MLAKKTVYEGFKKLSINFGISLDDKKEYMATMFKDLEREGFSDKDFVEAIYFIKKNNITLFGNMPSLATFIEARPKVEYSLPEHKMVRIQQEPKKQLERAYTQEEIDGFKRETEEKLKTTSKMFHSLLISIRKEILSKMEKNLIKKEKL